MFLVSANNTDPSLEKEETTSNKGNIKNIYLQGNVKAL